jgi:hypothetical protein
VSVTQSDEVFWVNNDTAPHWPVPWCYGLKTAPGQTSTNFMVYPGSTSAIIPQTLQYQDALGSGTGVINIYGTFAPAPVAPPTPAGTYTAAAGGSVQVATGGMSSYDTSQSTGLPAWLTLGELTPDSSGGVYAFVAAGTASGSVAKFNLNATDGLGNNIVQQVQVTVS